MEFAQFPSLLFLSPSLPHPTPHLPFGYSLLPWDATSRNRLFCFVLFWSWLLAGASEGLRVREKCKPGPRRAERRTDGQITSLAIYSLELSANY